jgi:hypothetical protein
MTSAKLSIKLHRTVISAREKNRAELKSNPERPCGANHPPQRAN